jgi:hypothetical protein
MATAKRAVKPIQEQIGEEKEISDNNSNSNHSTKKIKVKAFIVYVEYYHLNKTDLSEFISSQNDWLYLDTKEDVMIPNGEKGDFEEGATFVSISDSSLNDNDIELKKFNMTDDNYMSYFANNYLNHRTESFRDKNFIIKKTDRYDSFEEEYEFNKFSIDSLTVDYNEGGTIESFDFGDDNTENLVSISESNVIFSVSDFDEKEYNGTSIKCYVLESGEAKLIDLDLVIENFHLTDGVLNLIYK